MWLKDYRRTTKHLSEWLFWDSIEGLPEGVMQQRDGSFLATIRYQGPDMASALDVELVTFSSQMNAILKRFQAGWALLSEARRSPVTTYPKAEWPDPISRLVDAERQRYFETPGQLFRTTTYLTLVYRQPQEKTSRLRRILFEHLPEEDATAHVLETFYDTCTRTVRALRDCCGREDESGPRAVLLDHGALLTYLHSTVSPKTHRVNVSYAYLNSYLTDTPLTTGLYPCWGDPRYPETFGGWIRCITPKAPRGLNPYPEDSWPGMLEVLYGLPIEYRACQRFLPMDNAAAAKTIYEARKNWHGQRKRGSQIAAEKFTKRESELQEQVALDYAQEASEAQTSAQRGHVSFGHLTTVVVVWDVELERATQKAQLVEQAFTAAGCIAEIETLNTVEAWRGTIPGDCLSNVRKPLFHSMNLTHMAPPLATPWRGAQWNAHLNGPPLLQAVGPGQTPVGIDPYVGDVGHVFVGGPTGSGKSTLVNTMALQWLKYAGAQVYIFEIGQSFRCATYGVQGQWYEVGEELTERYRADAHLDDASFQPWVSAWLPPPGRWQCFELTELMKTPTMVPRVVRAIFDTIAARLTGAPTMLVFDEAWKYIRPLNGVDNDAHAFVERIEEFLRTLRKLNGMVVFSTQSLADMVNSPLGAIIAESCLTKIFLANSQAMKPEIGKLYAGYGLNERQRQVIAGLTPKRQYYLTTEGGTTVFDLALGPITLAFAGASRQEDLQQMADIYGKDPARFGANWLDARGIAWEEVA